MLWDLYQQYRISELDRRLDNLAGAPTGDAVARDATHRLEEKLDRLALISRAMFELLQESSAFSEERLSAKVLEIDLRDGQADGKVTAQPKKCSKCAATMSPKFGRCLFCGQRDDSASPFA